MVKEDLKIVRGAVRMRLRDSALIKIKRTTTGVPQEEPLAAQVAGAGQRGRAALRDSPSGRSTE